MFISELEIDNFKSFARKTRIPFSQGFTVVSGPNGSGKSNIVDAILFVLGLSSSHSLRAEKLTDLINISSARSTAEVALRFSDGTRIRRQDQADRERLLQLLLHERPALEAERGRRLPGGQLGVRPHGYNVVMQGDITRIIEMSDLERRRVIDEIAGVAEFDLRRSQALAELEVVKERIEREELLLREASRRLEELAVEREQALVHQQLTQQLAEYEDSRAAAELAEKEKERAILASLTEGHRIEGARLEEDRSHEAHNLSYLQGDLVALDEEIHRRSGSEYLKLLSQLEEVKGIIRSSRLSIDAHRREREENLQAINRAYADTRRMEEKTTAAQALVRSLSIDRTNLAMEQAAVQARLRADRDAAGRWPGRDGLGPGRALRPARVARRVDCSARGSPQAAGPADRAEPGTDARARTARRAPGRDRDGRRRGPGFARGDAGLGGGARGGAPEGRGRALEVGADPARAALGPRATASGTARERAGTDAVRGPAAGPR